MMGTPSGIRIEEHRIESSEPLMAVMVGIVDSSDAWETFGIIVSCS